MRQGPHKTSIKTVNIDIEEMNARIKEHRRNIFLRWLLIIAITAGCVFIVGLIIHMRTYTSYKITKQIQRNDVSDAGFLQMDGNILKYSADGASYINLSGETIWSQSYEMQQPQADVCGQYAAIYDLQGNQIFIVDKSGSLSNIKTSLPIGRVSVSGNGVIAVLTEEGMSSLIQLYDKDANQLAKGEIHIKNGGYPVDVALSDNGQGMGVAMLDVKDGSLKTTITFYNFGSVGQDESDNIVGSFSYSKTVMPRIEFVSDDEMIAFGDDKVIVFKGNKNPQEEATLQVKDEIKSILYDDEGFGLVFENDGEDKKENAYKLSLYNMQAKIQNEVTFNISYNDIYFMSNGEICLQNDNELMIIKRNGRIKFTSEFDTEIYKIVPGRLYRSYTVMMPKETCKIRIK